MSFILQPTQPHLFSNNDGYRDHNNNTPTNNANLCRELSMELERAAKLSLVPNNRALPPNLSSMSQHQDEAEALSELLRRYRAVVDVSDLWMTTDVRLLTRLLSTRALEDDAWLRELEDLVVVRVDLLSGLKDSVSRLRKLRDTTRNNVSRTVEPGRLGRH